MELSGGTIAIGALLVAVLVFLWNLHSDFRDLSGRVARIEGTLDALREIVFKHTELTNRPS